MKAPTGKAGRHDTGIGINSSSGIGTGINSSSGIGTGGSSGSSTGRSRITNQQAGVRTNSRADTE